MGIFRYIKGKVAAASDRKKEDNIQDPAPAADPLFYTVVSGDSLSTIAKKFYGDAMKYPIIFEANIPMLTDPNRIYPGQVLRIPPLS